MRSGSFELAVKAVVGGGREGVWVVVGTETLLVSWTGDVVHRAPHVLREVHVLDGCSFGLVPASFTPLFRRPRLIQLDGPREIELPGELVMIASADRFVAWQPKPEQLNTFTLFSASGEIVTMFEIRCAYPGWCTGDGQLFVAERGGAIHVFELASGRRIGEISHAVPHWSLPMVFAAGRLYVAGPQITVLDPVGGVERVIAVPFQVHKLHVIDERVLAVGDEGVFAIDGPTVEALARFPPAGLGAETDGRNWCVARRDVRGGYVFARDTRTAPRTLVSSSFRCQGVIAGRIVLVEPKRIALLEMTEPDGDVPGIGTIAAFSEPVIKVPAMVTTLQQLGLAPAQLSTAIVTELADIAKRATADLPGRLLGYLGYAVPIAGFISVEIDDFRNGVLAKLLGSELAGAGLAVELVDSDPALRLVVRRGRERHVANLDPDMVARDLVVALNRFLKQLGIDRRIAQIVAEDQRSIFLVLPTARLAEIRSVLPAWLKPEIEIAEDAKPAATTATRYRHAKFGDATLIQQLDGDRMRLRFDDGIERVIVARYVSRVEDA